MCVCVCVSVCVCVCLCVSVCVCVCVCVFLYQFIIYDKNWYMKSKYQNIFIVVLVVLFA